MKDIQSGKTAAHANNLFSQNETFSIAIDEERCIGCGFCREHLSSVIYYDGYTARIDPEQAGLLAENEILLKRAEDAEADCPAGSFTVTPHTSRAAGTQADAHADAHTGFSG
jgi:ferredoxin